MKKLLFIILLTSTICSAQTFDIVSVPESFTKQEQIKFNSNAAYVKSEWDIRMPFLPVNFTTKFSSTTSFRCKAGTALHGSYCNDGKVWDFVNDLHPQFALVIVDGQSGGGAIIGGNIAVVGNKVLDGAVHELGHLFGLPDGGLGIMGASANGLYNSTFEIEHQKTICQRIESVVGTLNIPDPTINIYTPANNTALFTGGSIFIAADISNCIAVEIYDGVLKSTEMCWDRNQRCNKTDGVKFWLTMLTPGQHTVTLKAIGLKQSISQSITINVN